MLENGIMITGGILTKLALELELSYGLGWALVK
jgi:hypothetical protein